MHDLTIFQGSHVVMQLPAMSEESVNKVRELEAICLHLPQVDIKTEHAFHAGMYARTLMIPAGVVMTGAEIKIPTILIVNGDVLIYGDEGPQHFSGYHVTLGGIGRKQAFMALENTYLTMVFPSNAENIEDVEIEFTDEHEMLMSRRKV